jgi:dihydropteroate synthase
VVSEEIDRICPKISRHQGGRDRPGRFADVLTLGRRTFADTDLLVMAIVNRTRDSFYDGGATYAEERALERVRAVVAEGADIVDIGGVKAGPGDLVDEREEIRRTVPLVAKVRAEFPDVVISVDTWRAGVAREVCRAGADLLNDAWGGFDPALAEVAAEEHAALVCTHTNGAAPRTPPYRPAYDDVVAAAVEATVALAERAVSLGVARDSILIDPAHDFEKNTWHSLELTRRLDEMVATGWPVLVSLSHKDFVGETLGRPVDERLFGTLAATSVSAWHGARVYRAHEVPETRQVLDMVAAIRGTKPPARVVRGLA